MTDPEYLTSQAAAARAGVTHSYLCRLCRAKVIPARKWGAAWQIRPADVDAWRATANHQAGHPTAPRQ